MRKKRKKCTLSAEHLAKMQAGRKRASNIRKQMKILDEHGFHETIEESASARMIRQTKQEFAKNHSR